MSNKKKTKVGNLSDAIKGELSNAAIKVGLTTALTPSLGILAPLVGEIFGVLIPTKKQERLEKLLKFLFSKQYNIPFEDIDDLLTSSDFNFEQDRHYSDEFLDILEDVVNQAVRATSDERLEYLASVLEKGLTDEEFDHLKTKRLLEIFAKINDVEVLILQSYALQDSGSEFRQKHKNIFDLKKTSRYTRKLSEAEEKTRALLQHYDDNLINLGLIGFPDFINWTVPTYLGRQLLNLIGLSVEQTWVANPINPLDVRQELASESKNILKKIEDTKKQAIQEINKALRKIESAMKRSGR
jgi:hypothetical protein